MPRIPSPAALEDGVGEVNSRHYWDLPSRDSRWIDILCFQLLPTSGGVGKILVSAFPGRC